MSSFRARWEREVWTSTAITDGCRVLLLALVRHMDARGYVSVPRPTLAAELGRNERRIGERIEQAVDAQFLARVRRGQKGVTSVYRGMFPGPAQQAANPPAEQHSQQAVNPLAEMGAANPPADDAFSRRPGGPASTRATGTSPRPHAQVPPGTTSERHEDRSTPAPAVLHGGALRSGSRPDPTTSRATSETA